MIDNAAQPQPPGKHRYTSVVQGMDLANEFIRSRLSTAEFARQRGVSAQMVRYWTTRARRLVASAKPDLVQVAEVTAAGTIEPMPSAPALPPPSAATVPKPVIATALSAPTIELRLPNGLCIGIAAGFSPQVVLRRRRSGLFRLHGLARRPLAGRRTARLTRPHSRRRLRRT